MAEKQPQTVTMPGTYAFKQAVPISDRLAVLCYELVGLLGLRQGSVEIHCHKGKPYELHVHDKSIKFKDTEGKNGTC